MPIFNKCAPDGIDDLIKVGDEFMNKPHIKKMFTKSGADTIVSDKFFEIFRRPIEEWRDLKISKTKIKLFDNEVPPTIIPETQVEPGEPKITPE